MIDAERLAEITGRLINITHDLTLVECNNSINSHNFSMIALKSLLLQIKTVEVLLSEIINEEEEV